MRASATEVKNNFGKYLKIAANEDVIIVRNGKELACLSRYDPDAKNKFLVCEGAAAYSSQEPLKATYEEFLRLVENSVNRYEYINGIIYLLASPTHHHQSVSSKIYVKLYNWFQGKKCKPFYSPYDVTMQIGQERNTVQPDILVICDEEKVDEKGKYHGIPSLVVEVLSQSTKSKDMLVKLELYMKGGVDEFWIVDPESKQVYIYTFKDKEILSLAVSRHSDTAKSIIFDGLEVNVEEIF